MNAQQIAIEAAKPALVAAGAGVKTALPWIQIVTTILDTVLGMAAGVAGVDLPTADQLMLFVGMVGAASPAVVGAVVYDWWRDDGYAGGKTLELLMPMTEVSGWSPGAQIAFAYQWYSTVIKMPGKGGGAGRSLWNGKLAAYKSGKPVTYTVTGLGITRTVQRPGFGVAGLPTSTRQALPKGQDCAPGYVEVGGSCRKRLLAWNKGATPAVIGGVPCTDDVANYRCQNGALIGRYLWNLTQAQVDQLNAGLYDMLVDLPTAQDQVTAWRAIARSRLREIGIPESDIRPVYGFDGEDGSNVDGLGHTIAVASSGTKAAAATGAIGTALAALAWMAIG